jgi:hypothetical protein
MIFPRRCLTIDDALVLLLITRQNGDSSSGLSQAQGDTAANTAVAAGDDSDAPAQVKRICCWHYFSFEFDPTSFSAWGVTATV